MDDDSVTLHSKGGDIPFDQEDNFEVFPSSM